MFELKELLPTHILFFESIPTTLVLISLKLSFKISIDSESFSKPPDVAPMIYPFESSVIE